MEVDTRWHASTELDHAVTRFWFYAFILSYNSLPKSRDQQQQQIPSFLNQKILACLYSQCKLFLHYPFFTDTDQESLFNSFFLLSLSYQYTTLNNCPSHFAKDTNLWTISPLPHYYGIMGYIIVFLYSHSFSSLLISSLNLRYMWMLCAGYYYWTQGHDDY